MNKLNVVGRHAHRRFERKPDCKLLPAGTIVLFDTANFLGEVGPQHAARTLNAIISELVSQGLCPVFIWEYRSYLWVRGWQVSIQEMCMLDALVEGDNFVIIGESNDLSVKSEADDPILQYSTTLQELVRVVIISCDRYTEFAHSYPLIVHTDRVRQFAVLRLADRILVAFKGLARAILIDGEGVKPIARTCSLTDIEAPMVCPVENVDMSCNGSEEEDDDWDPGEDVVDRKRAKRRAECSRRDRRLRVQAIRDGHWQVARVSARRRAAADMAAISERLGGLQFA